MAYQAFPPGTGLVYSWRSPVIDLVGGAVPTNYQVIPPMPFRLGPFFSGFWEIVTTNTCTVSPTFQIGINSSFNDLYASQTQAGFTTGVAYTRVTPTAASPFILGDLTANGMSVRITVAATATALTARFTWVSSLVPV